MKAIHLTFMMCSFRTFCTILLLLAVFTTQSTAIFIDGKGNPNLAQKKGSDTTVNDLIQAALQGTGGNLSQFSSGIDISKVDPNTFFIRPTSQPQTTTPVTTSQQTEQSPEDSQQVQPLSTENTDVDTDPISLDLGELNSRTTSPPTTTIATVPTTSTTTTTTEVETTTTAIPPTTTTSTTTSATTTTVEPATTISTETTTVEPTTTTNTETSTVEPAATTTITETTTVEPATTISTETTTVEPATAISTETTTVEPTTTTSMETTTVEPTTTTSTETTTVEPTTTTSTETTTVEPTTTTSTETTTVEPATTVSTETTTVEPTTTTSTETTTVEPTTTTSTETTTVEPTTTTSMETTTVEPTTTTSTETTTVEPATTISTETNTVEPTTTTSMETTTVEPTTTAGTTTTTKVGTVPTTTTTTSTTINPFTTGVGSAPETTGTNSTDWTNNTSTTASMGSEFIATETSSGSNKNATAESSMINGTTATDSLNVTDSGLDATPLPIESTVGSNTTTAASATTTSATIGTKSTTGSAFVSSEPIVASSTTNVASTPSTDPTMTTAPPTRGTTATSDMSNTEEPKTFMSDPMLSSDSSSTAETTTSNSMSTMKPSVTTTEAPLFTTETAIESTTTTSTTAKEPTSTALTENSPTTKPVSIIDDSNLGTDALTVYPPKTVEPTTIPKATTTKTTSSPTVTQTKPASMISSTTSATITSTTVMPSVTMNAEKTVEPPTISIERTFEPTSTTTVATTSTIAIQRTYEPTSSTMFPQATMNVGEDNTSATIVNSEATSAITSSSNATGSSDGPKSASDADTDAESNTMSKDTGITPSPTGSMGAAFEPTSTINDERKSAVTGTSVPYVRPTQDKSKIATSTSNEETKEPVTTTPSSTILFTETHEGTDSTEPVGAQKETSTAKFPGNNQLKPSSSTEDYPTSEGSTSSMIDVLSAADVPSKETEGDHTQSSMQVGALNSESNSTSNATPAVDLTNDNSMNETTATKLNPIGDSDQKVPNSLPSDGGNGLIPRSPGRPNEQESQPQRIDRTPKLSLTGLNSSSTDKTPDYPETTPHASANFSENHASSKSTGTESAAVKEPQKKNTRSISNDATLTQALAGITTSPKKSTVPTSLGNDDSESSKSKTTQISTKNPVANSGPMPSNQDMSDTFVQKPESSPDQFMLDIDSVLSSDAISATPQANELTKTITSLGDSVVLEPDDMPQISEEPEISGTPELLLGLEASEEPEISLDEEFSEEPLISEEPYASYDEEIDSSVFGSGTEQEIAVDLIVEHPDSFNETVLAEEVRRNSNEFVKPSEWEMGSMIPISKVIKLEPLEFGEQRKDDPGYRREEGAFEMSMSTNCTSNCSDKFTAFEEFIRSGSMDNVLAGQDYSGVKVRMKGDALSKVAPEALQNAGTSLGVIVGLAVGAVALVSIVVLTGLVIMRRNQNGRNPDDREEGYPETDDEDDENRGFGEEEGSFMISNFGGSPRNTSAMIPWMNYSANGNDSNVQQSTSSFISVDTLGSVRIAPNESSTYRFDETTSSSSGSEVEDIIYIDEARPRTES